MGPIGPGSDLSEKAKLLIETFNRGNVSTDMRKSIIRVLMEKEGISGAQIREHLISATHLRPEFEHEDRQFTEFMQRRWEHERKEEEEKEHHEWEHRRGLNAIRNIVVITGGLFIILFALYFFIAVSSDSSKTSDIPVIEEIQKSPNEL